MNLSESIERMHSYYEHFGAQTGYQALIVNVENIDDLNEIRAEFAETSVNVLNISESSAEDDQLPEHGNVIDWLHSQSKPILLTELTTFWKFYGQEALGDILSEIMHGSSKAALVVLAFQCRDMLYRMVKADIRREQQVCFVEGKRTKMPKLVMIQSQCRMDIVGESEKAISGIKNVATELENWCENEEDPGTLTIFTHYGKRIFRNAVYDIEWISGDMDIIHKLDPTTMGLDRSLGTPEQWHWLLEMLSKMKTVRQCVVSLLECQDLVSGLGQYYRWNENEQWLYYIALHLWRPQSNPYLCRVISTCSRSDGLIRDIYRTMAEDVVIKKRLIGEDQYDEGIFWQNFWEIYQNRRKCLELIRGNISSESQDFCNWIKLKHEKHAIYYLTDITDEEVQTIFELLNKRGNIVNRELNSKVLEKIYPKLVQYLRSCALCAEGVESKTLKEIQKYFDLYKYCKLVNYIDSDFEEWVHKEALERSFNKFPKRDATVEKICKRSQRGEKIEVWFIDAMGVEFLNYVLEACKLKKFETKSWIHRANIPTETEQNYTKELRNKFAEAHIRILDAKEIDEGKHDREKDYQYSNSDLPIHLIQELKNLDKILNRIETNLRYQEIHSIFIIPDHGASRFAVLSKDSEEVVDVGTKCFSSGRYCEWQDGLEKLEDAIRSDDEKYYVMSGYRRFGGRKAAVEVHGGATLEEVLVPMIEIRLPGAEVEILIDENEIKVDYKTRAVLKFKSVKKLSGVHIVLQDGRTFEAVTEDGNHFEVKTDITKAGDWTFEVYEKSRRIAQDLHFKTVSRGMQCNSTEDDFF